ncbi:recombinase family protein [Micromonospora sp. WMMD998]|uniref:recombinase family protein n=1 Tax=Micromonospora sp. WMMD998 TaxID=3016092 RepID=UPI00249C2903|nr:recombinase family protein [Micromonospora sp. WMMD998]WFE41908.1 recombinase family protein [Micromonospora sp. WMMD998]
MPRRRTPLAAVPDQPSRVVLYRRVSALMGRDGDDFHSPDVQAAAMRRATTGMHEVAVIDDIDVSGTHFNRDGIERVRALARSRQIDAVAVYDVSRFGRDVLESLLVLRELSQFGVTIISASERIDTSTPSGEWMLTNLLAIAQMRAKEIGRSWSGAIAARAESGRHHGRPLGYTRVDKQMVPDPVLGPAVAEVFRRYAAGDPIGEITSYLAAVRGRPMHTANVKKLLRSPVYLGKVVAGDQVLPGLHPPLVDEQTWDRVQRRLAAEAGTPPRHLAPTWSLVGLAECPNGHKLQRQGERLVCGEGCGDVKGGTCPGVGRPRLAAVEAEVLDQIAGWAAELRTDHVAQAARLARVTAARADRVTLERELKQARAAMVRLARNNALTPLPDEVYREAMAELREAERTAAVELARLGDDDPSPDPEVAAGAVDALLALWHLPEATHADRGKALRSVVERVLVRPAQRWRQPEAERVTVVFRW